MLREAQDGNGQDTPSPAVLSLGCGREQDPQPKPGGGSGRSSLLPLDQGKHQPRTREGSGLCKSTSRGHQCHHYHDGHLFGDGHPVPLSSHTLQTGFCNSFFLSRKFLNENLLPDFTQVHFLERSGRERRRPWMWLDCHPTHTTVAPPGTLGWAENFQGIPPSLLPQGASRRISGSFLLFRGHFCDCMISSV